VDFWSATAAQSTNSKPAASMWTPAGFEVNAMSSIVPAVVLNDDPELMKLGWIQRKQI
jgi:hypothetical protein